MSYQNYHDWAESGHREADEARDQTETLCIELLNYIDKCSHPSKTVLRAVIAEHGRVRVLTDKRIDRIKKRQKTAQRLLKNAGLGCGVDGLIFMSRCGDLNDNYDSQVDDLVHLCHECYQAFLRIEGGREDLISGWEG